MPEMNGIQVAKELMDQQIAVVFVTAYSQYAIEAFKVNAVDYILKPIMKDEVERVLYKLRPHIVPQQTISEVMIHFLGNFQVSSKGKVLEWPTEKTAELFAYLVYHAGEKVEKWQLCDLLWPHVPPEKAMHNVYNAVYRLKRLLDAHQIQYAISNKRGYYEFTIEYAMIDFQQMDQLLVKFPGVNAESLIDYEQTEALYMGGFLSGKDYSWCQAARAYYEQSYNRIVQNLLDYYVAYDLDEKAISTGGKILQLYPEHEYIAVLLMPLYATKGKRQLKKFYKDYSNYFTSELGSTLSNQTVQAYKEMMQELDFTF